MTVARLLVEFRERGVQLFAEGEHLRYRAPRGVLTDDLLARLRTAKDELLDALREEGAGLLDTFLADSTLPAAIFHSRALNRDFVLARDEAALDALTDADRTLPVLFFGECGKLSQLGLEGLRVLLDLRAEFGPEVRVGQVRAARG